MFLHEKKRKTQKKKIFYRIKLRKKNKPFHSRLKFYSGDGCNPNSIADAVKAKTKKKKQHKQYNIRIFKYVLHTYFISNRKKNAKKKKNELK